MEFIKYIDIFGTRFNFYIENRPKYYTFLGGYLSLLTIILCLIIFISLSRDDFNRKNPQTTTNSIPSAGYKKIKFGEEKIYIPWRLIDYDQHFINHTNILYPIINYRYGKKDDRGGIPLNNNIIEYRLCSETEMKDLDNNKFIFNIPLNEVYCIKMEDLLMGGSWTDNSIYLIQFDLFMCKNGISYNDENENCTSFEKFMNITENTKSWLFEIYYPEVQFQPANLNEPVIVIYKKMFYHLSKHTNKILRLFLIENVLEDDKDLIFNNYKNSSYWGVSFITSDDYLNNEEKDYLMSEGSSSRLFSMNIYFDMGIIFHTRKYKKIVDILSYNFPILMIIFEIFKYIAKNLKIASTHKKITEILFENDINAKKHSDRDKLIKKGDNKAKKSIINLKEEENKDLSLSCLNRNYINNYNHNKSNYLKLNNNISKEIDKNHNKSIIKYTEDNIGARNGLSNIYRKNIFMKKEEVKNKNNNIYPRQDNTSLNTSAEKILFPFRYYLFARFLKNVDIKKCDYLYSKKFIKVYTFLSQLFDIKSYLILYKQFNILKISLLDESELHDIESKNKININNRLFLRNINYCIDEHKFTIFTKNVLGDDFSKKNTKIKRNKK